MKWESEENFDKFSSSMKMKWELRDDEVDTFFKTTEYT